MAEAAADTLTHDAFLNGQVKAWQPRAGYRAGTDAVFLAAACRARSGDAVLELGCGVGVASLCLAARVPGVEVTGVERQAEYADIARRNAAEAGAQVHVVTADLAALPADLRQRSFAHVIANPPYYLAHEGPPAQDAGRDAALREDTPLADWVACARSRLTSRGWLTMIVSADRLPELLGALGPGFGGITALPLSGRVGRPAGRVLLRAQKGGRAPFALLSPLVLRNGAGHGEESDGHSDIARRILRDGAALSWDRAGQPDAI